MVDRWIVFGGWATPPSALAPLFGGSAELIDVNGLMPSLVRNDMLRADWETFVIDSVKNLAGNRHFGCAGWSTGSLFAYATAKRLPPRAAVFLSATPSFCRRQGFPCGQKAATLRVMRKRLATDPQNVMKNFYARSGMPASPLSLFSTFPASPLNPLSTRLAAGRHGGEGKSRWQQLIEGLHFLEQATVLPVTPLPCPSLFLHGKSDLIVPFQAGVRFAEGAGGRFEEYEGGHAFFRGREKDIAGVVKTFEDSLG